MNFYGIKIINQIVFRADIGTFLSLKVSAKWISMELDWLINFSVTVFV